MAKSIMKPSLRFKGFTEDWEQRELGEISDVTKLAGFEFTEYVQYSDSGKIIALRGLNVKNNSLVLDDVKYIDASDFSKLNRSKLFKNDMLLTYVGTVGDLAIVPKNDKYYLAPNVARVRFNKQIYPKYASQLMGTKKFYNQIIVPLIATSSQPALSMENVRKFVLDLPKLNEQIKIGEHFDKLDNLITLHQRKCDRLKKVKIALLEKMFPNGNNKKPDLRFKGFTDAWEQRELGIISSIIKGQQLGKSSMIDSGPYYVLNGGINLSGYTNCWNTSENKISISEGGNSCGFVNYNTQKFWSGGHNYTLNNLRIDSKYLYQFLKFNEINIMDLRVGSGLPNIQKSTLSDFNIIFPSNKEQKILGLFFTKLDSLITLHQRKCDQLKKVKIALLEKMFI